MNKIIIFLVMALLAISSVQALTLGKVRAEESASEDYFVMHVNVINEENIDRDGVHINVWIPALDLYVRSRSNDIEGGDKQGRFALLPSEDIESGSYWAKVKVSNGKHSDSRWVLLNI